MHVANQANVGEVLLPQFVVKFSLARQHETVSSDGLLVASREWAVTVVANGVPVFGTSWPFFAFILVVLAAILLVWLVRRRRKPEAPRR